MEEKKEESEIQNISEEIETQAEEIPSEQVKAPAEEIEAQSKALQKTKILTKTTPPKEIETPKKTRYPMPLNKIGFFIRGLIAIAIGSLMFLNQDNALQILGILLGSAIIVLSVLNIFIGYKERFKEFYAKWLIVGGVIGIIFGLIIVFVPSLVSGQVFLFLTLVLIVLGFCDIVLAIYLRKIPGTRGALILLGLLSIVAGALIYADNGHNLVPLFCMYAIASGVLSIAISIFMKKPE